MSDNNGNPTPRGTIAKQAETILEGDSDEIELVCGLNFRSLSSYDDQYADWHASYSLEAMARAHLLRLLMDYSIAELHRRLDENPDDAAELGFESIPARTTIGRAWRDRFDEELIRSLEYNSRKILEHAHSIGNPLGMRCLEPDDKGDVSRQTEDPDIGEKAEEITKAMQKLVFPAFSFNRASNAHYEKDSFLELQCQLGLNSSAAESGTDLYDDDTSRPEGAPDGDTHLFNIKRLSHEGVMKMVDEAIGRTVHQAKHHLQFKRPAESAIDMTYLVYGGDNRDELEMVMGAPDGKDYDWCYKFATLSIVGDNVKFTLAMTPVRPGYLVGEVVRELYWKASKHVSISTIYADREFCTVDTIRALEEAGVKYMIPSPKNSRVKREIGRMTRDVKVLNNYTMRGEVSGGPTNAPESTNLILLPSTKNESKTVAFITNRDVDDEIDLDRREAKGWVDRYSRRWSIEISYKTIKDFLAWTTSTDFVVRLFYFGFAVMLYNMWLLVDLLVQISLDLEHRYKPRVTAKRFLNLARKHLGAPG